MTRPLGEFIVADPQPLLPLSPRSCPQSHRHFSQNSMAFYEKRKQKQVTLGYRSNTHLSHRLLRGSHCIAVRLGGRATAKNHREHCDERGRLRGSTGWQSRLADGTAASKGLLRSPGMLAC